MEKSNQTFHFSGTINNYGTITGDVVRPVYHAKTAATAAAVAEAEVRTEASAVEPSVESSPQCSSSGPSPSVEPSAAAVPSTLATDEAQEELRKYQRAGMLDERFQPVHLTRAQMGCIVIRVGEVLGLAAQWRDFGALWGVKSESLRAQFNQGEASKATRDFCRRLNEV